MKTQQVFRSANQVSNNETKKQDQTNTHLFDLLQRLVVVQSQRDVRHRHVAEVAGDVVAAAAANAAAVRLPASLALLLQQWLVTIPAPGENRNKTRAQNA
jgi:hypothetical protein